MANGEYKLYDPNNWKPTRKWVAFALTGLLTIVSHALASSGWDTTEWAELTTLGIALVGAYFYPDASDPSYDEPVGE